MEVEPAIHHSFGEILRAYRKRKRITQKQLAQLLDTHANTISSWELGTYLPQTRGLVLELARHLGLNDQETRQLLEASLTALSSHWHLPSPRNPFFTGREDILDTLHQSLSTNQASYVLHGLGAIRCWHWYGGYHTSEASSWMQSEALQTRRCRLPF
jgi:transcriptional regulator with XRE-family HTH domain